MKFIQILLLSILAMLFSSCAESTNSLDYKITADAGEDKRVIVNETVTISGKGRTTDNSELSYLWEKGATTLATTATFSYTPTVIGTDILKFTVQANDGSSVSDTMKVFVTEKKVVSSIPTISQSQKDEYLNAVNRARSNTQSCGSKGVFPATNRLTWSDKLYKSAYEHTQDLVSSRTFSHSGSGTKSDWTGEVLGHPSILRERVETYNYSWKYIGENIGAGTIIDTPEKMVDGWLKSDSHCANLMNPNFTELGMAMIKDENTKYIHYWTQNFGTPR